MRKIIQIFFVQWHISFCFTPLHHLHHAHEENWGISDILWVRKVTGSVLLSILQETHLLLSNNLWVVKVAGLILPSKIFRATHLLLSDMLWVSKMTGGNDSVATVVLQSTHFQETHLLLNRILCINELLCAHYYFQLVTVFHLFLFQLLNCLIFLHYQVFPVMLSYERQLKRIMPLSSN
jgi:hypothetical protein